MSRETIEVDKRYVWALEVLALDYLEDSASYDNYVDAKEVVEEANLSRPRDKHVK